MIEVTTPSPWNSVHRPIEYVYNHESVSLSATANVGGKLRIVINPAFSHTIAVGDKILISGITSGSTSDVPAAYNRFHTVTVVASGGALLTTDTDYVGSVSVGGDVRFIRLPEIELYAGYLPGEEYDDELPLRLVATFTPENSPSNDVRIDVSEYLKSIFRILPPVEGIDFNMFNRFRLKFDGTYKDYYHVLNSSIKTAELNAVYVNTNAYLNSKFPPIVFGCGKTILSTLTGSVVVNHVYDGSVSEGDYNPADYATADYFTTQ